MLEKLIYNYFIAKTYSGSSSGVLALCNSYILIILLQINYRSYRKFIKFKNRSNEEINDRIGEKSTLFYHFFEVEVLQKNFIIDIIKMYENF